MTLPFILRVLAADIKADFLERDNPAKVMVGEWDVFKMVAGPRVVLGLGTGDPLDIGGAGGAQHYGMGYEWSTGEGTVARALAGLSQRVIIWCGAPAPAGTAPGERALVAQEATFELFRATFAALWHSHGGPFPWGGVEWLHEASALTTYGGAVRWWAAFPMPIVDDDDLVVMAEDGKGATTLERAPDEPIAEAPDWTASQADLDADA
jgi:hypothetical protein